MNDWVRDAVWWHVYPLGFAGADTAGADRSDSGGLRRLTGWLDYAVELGMTGLALGPVFASGTHGYDTVDYFRIDERLGTDADFDDLVRAARERGLRLLLDGVFNHVGREYHGQQLLRRNGSGEVATFEGHGGLLALDHDNEQVQDLVGSVMKHWLERGVDGWRLDAAYAVPTRFWADVLPGVRESHPDSYVFGEVIHGDYARIVADSGLDAVTQYELWKAVWSSLRDRNFFELTAALDRHNGYLDTFAPLTFIGNHDVTRIASAVPDARHHAHALVVLMTVGGTPAVYYGDEQGMSGVKEDRAGGDDAVRPAFPAMPAGLPPDGDATHALHRELIALRRVRSWLHRARTRVLTLTNEQLSYASSDGGNRITVALNLGDRPMGVKAAGSVLAAAPDTVLRNGQLTVPAHGWAVTG